MPLIGTHVSVSGGLYRAVERASLLEVEAMQIFTCNPLQWRGRNLSGSDVDAFRRALLGSSVRSVVVHSSYLINLAGYDRVRARSADALVDEIERCYQLGVDSVVLHPGSSTGGDRGEAIGRLVSSLGEVIERTMENPVRILLETMAGAGGSLGASVEELGGVLDAMAWDDRLGICADICHLFGAGADVRSRGGYERLVSSIEKHVGLSRVGCFHLSDNKGPRGSNVDRHEHLGQGEIGIVPFGMVMSDERFADVPCILETPKDGVGDEGNIALLKKMRGA
ncbi:MAG: deoxyribonuclease IV [Synergistaceae bacterium]|jgi:deoxyribonuclease-4|nr:deoxyribonuclease IV [Synergistaceae bacterium]